MSKEIQFEKPRVRIPLTQDGLQNIFTGMGTASASSSHNNWKLSPALFSAQIDAVYRESWLAQAICSIPVEDATREWRRFTGDKAEEIKRYELDIELQTSVALAKTWARAYGGATILMITDQDIEEELDLRKIKKDSLKRLLVLDRFDLTAQQLNITNPVDENFMLPDHYTLAYGSQKIHYSHVVRFEGIKLPRRIAMLEHGWGDSQLRKIMQDISGVAASFMGVSELMQEANVDVISAPGLASDLTTDEESDIAKRYQFFNLMKSSFGLSLLDTEEKLDRLTLNLSGVSQAQEQLLTWICGAAGIPMSRLFGTSAKGMNATGEGDEDVYYDRVKSIQTKDLGRPLAKLDQVMIRSALGELPSDIDYTWNPLSQLDDEEQASTDYTESQTAQTYYDMGIIKKSHIAIKLQARDTYQLDDAEIEELKKLEAESESEDDDDFTLKNENDDTESSQAA